MPDPEQNQKTKNTSRNMFSNMFLAFLGIHEYQASFYILGDLLIGFLGASNRPWNEVVGNISKNFIKPLSAQTAETLNNVREVKLE